ncbi:MAG: enoyl-CoA hydratase/isomerase family protein [Gammaproteobacteria bacterium]|nr:enoyl-CoA hydratase/isomerase family protein [Gammaproteobacteria bacterium]MBQ0841002.1 enoyl-CoA hydratase/isomerase family protein [Gammaproteobacteria bacterium]
MSDLILVRNQGAIRFISMNRPDKLNAMSESLVDDLARELHVADDDQGVAVIVITGEGRAFSAGADLSDWDADNPAPAREVAAGLTRVMGFYGQLVAMNTPLIAAVQGYVLGGGCNLAISCDLVVAGQSAIFGYPEVRLGLAATGVTPTLVHQIGRKAAFELLTLCDNIDAEKALALGMINRIVADDQVLSEATKMAEQLASFNADALWLTKQTLRRAADLPLGKAIELGLDMGFTAKMYQ